MTERFPEILPQIVPVADCWQSDLYNRFLLRLGFPILPPVKLTNINYSGLEDRSFLNLLAEKTNFNHPKYQNSLKDHESKLSKIRWFNLSILLSLFCSVFYYLNEGLIVYVCLSIFSTFLAISQPKEILMIGILFVFIVSISWFNDRNIRLIIRDIWKDLYEKYGESFCVRESLSILYLLKEDDAIDSEYQKEHVSKRMLFLAKITKLLGQRKGRRYRGDKTRKRQIKVHYQRMALEIEERAFWLAIPRDTTLDDLRRDFNKFTQDYITGKTGNFQWQDREENGSTNNQTNLAKFKEAIALLKEVISIINPVTAILEKIIKPLLKIFF